MALGIGPGDEVIVPDLTFIATANAIRMTGAKAVLCDVLPDDACIDPRAVEKLITPKTKAIVPVHVTGHPADMVALTTLAKKHGLVIVEDAAEALGSSFQGKMLGTWGNAGCFSFSPMKTITTGQGGIAVTRDEAVYHRLIELKDQGRPKRGTGGDDDHPTLGYNFKLTNLQAAVGLAQLESFPERMQHQRDIYSWYSEELKGVPGIRIKNFDIAGGVCPQWVDAEVDGRDELNDLLRSHNMHCRNFWHPLHRQTPYKADDAAFPVTIQVSYSSLWLPSALRLTKKDIQSVCVVIKEWASGKA